MIVSGNARVPSPHGAGVYYPRKGVSSAAPCASKPAGGLDQCTINPRQLGGLHPDLDACRAEDAEHVQIDRTSNWFTQAWPTWSAQGDRACVVVYLYLVVVHCWAASTTVPHLTKFKPLAYLKIFRGGTQRVREGGPHGLYRLSDRSGEIVGLACYPLSLLHSTPLLIVLKLQFGI